MLFIQQLTVLLLFGGAGYLLSLVIALPGLIWAMLLLFFALWTNLLKREAVDQTSSQLMAVSGMLFIPMIVGILEYWMEIKGIIVAFLAVVTVGTLGALILTGVVLEWLIHRQDAKEAKGLKNSYKQEDT